MNSDLQTFTTAQRQFLATLEVISEPVSLDLMNYLSPLTSGALVDLIQKTRGNGLVVMDADQNVYLAHDTPANIINELRCICTPEAANNMLKRLSTHQAYGMVSLPVIAHLKGRAGLKHDAGFLELKIARQFVANGNVDQAMREYLNSVRHLKECLGNQESDLLFIEAILDLSHIYYLMGTGYPDIPELLRLAKNAAQRLCKPCSTILTGLLVGRFYFLSDSLSDVVSLLSSGIDLMKNSSDYLTPEQTSEFQGLFYYLQGKNKKAVDFFTRAIHSNRSDNSELFNIFLPVNLAYSYAMMGQFHRAIGILDSYMHRASLLSEPTLATFYRSILGTVLLLNGKMNDAWSHLNAAKDEAVEQKNALSIYFVQRATAFYLYSKGKITESHDLFEQTVEKALHDKTISRQNIWPWILEMLYGYTQHGLSPVGGLVFSQEIDKALTGPNVLLRGVALRIRAHQSSKQEEQPGTIEALLESSIAELDISGDTIQAAKTLVEMARLKLNQGDRESAHEYILQAMEMTSGCDQNIIPDDMKSMITPANITKDIVKYKNSFDQFMDVMEEFIPRPERDEVYSQFIRSTCQFFGSERGGLFTFNSRRKGLKPYLMASHNLSPIEATDANFRSRLNLIIKTWYNNQPLVMPKVRSDISAKDHNKAILCLPIQIKGRVWGVLYHENSYIEGAFELFDRALLTKITQRISSYFSQLDEYISNIELSTSQKSIAQLHSLDLKDGNYIEAKSSVMLNLLDQSDHIADTEAPVLILGETGVGKELLARRIHQMSSRRTKPLVIVDMTSIPENLVESELFGHEKGAFTNADGQKLGRIELAHKGTLFLDEIGEIPRNIQIKLLRVLQEKSFTRLGGRNVIRSDFRLISATNRDLSREVETGNFREDLYYRINVVQLYMPPLRKRSDDIVHIAEHFLRIFSHKYNKHSLSLSSRGRQILQDYAWPGNIRELRNVIERSVIFSSGNDLDLSAFTKNHVAHDALFSSLPTLDEIQRQYIRHVIVHTGGRIGGRGGAAEILGIKRTTLISRMSKLGLK